MSVSVIFVQFVDRQESDRVVRKAKTQADGDSRVWSGKEKSHHTRLVSLALVYFVALVRSLFTDG